MASLSSRTASRGVLGVAVLGWRGDTFGTFAFNRPHTSYERSGDGDLVVVRGRGPRKRVVTNFPAGRWWAAGWITGVLPNGHPAVDIVETAVPEQIGNPAAVAAASAADREWFAANPSQHSYFRDALPGEWPADKIGEPPVPGAVLVVEVRQHNRRLRTRTPAYWAFPGNPQPEDAR